MTLQHHGRFELIDPGTRPASIVLRHARGERRIEAVFGRVTQHNLPAALDGLAIRAGDLPQSFVVSSRGRDYAVHAQSLRVHRGVALYGRGLPLARYPLHRRLLWTALLWCARFDWGEALIRRVRGG